MPLEVIMALDPFTATIEQMLDQQRRAGEAGTVRGRHYTYWVEDVKQMKREGRLSEAETLLIECDRAAVAQAEIEDLAKPPWYAEQLGVVRRKIERIAKKTAKG